MTTTDHTPVDLDAVQKRYDDKASAHRALASHTGSGPALHLLQAYGVRAAVSADDVPALIAELRKARHDLAGVEMFGGPTHPAFAEIQAERDAAYAELGDLREAHRKALHEREETERVTDERVTAAWRERDAARALHAPTLGPDPSCLECSRVAGALRSWPCQTVTVIDLAGHPATT